MDTKKQTVIEKPVVPEFKLAKVGEKKRRKGAGIPWFGGGGGGGGFAGAVGGSGTGGGMSAMLGALGGKAAIVALVAVLGIGAYSVGRSLAPESKSFQADKKARLFADPKAEKKYAEDTSKLPKDSNRGNASSIGMVSGSLDGKTAAERAAEAEAAQAAQKAKDAEAAAAAEKAASEQPTVAGEAAAGAVDPAAMAAAAEAAAKAEEAKKAGMSKKFGGMTSSLGGGGGMSGGVTRGFDTPKFKADNGKALAFGKGRPATGRSAGRVVRAANSRGRGLASRQLDTAFKLSNQARTGSMESASAAADAAFNNNPGEGSAITGAGAGTGGGPASGAASGGSDPNGSGGGSPGATGNSTGDYGVDDCDVEFPQGGYMTSPSGGCISSVGGASVDPTDGIVKALKVMLIIIAILSAIQLILNIWKAVPWVAALYGVLGMLIMGLGAIVCIMGLVLVGMGRPIEGAIFAAIGGLTAALAWSGSGTATQGVTKIAQSIAVPIINTVVGAGSSIFAHNVNPRTMNEETGRWE